MPLIIAEQVKVWIAAAMVHGGVRQRAARRAQTIIGGLAVGRSLDDVGATTHHGETRLRCTKYDLGSGFRLVVLLRTSGILVLYINHHDGTDQWLNQLQGSVFRVEGIDDDIELPQLETTEPLPASHDLTSPERLLAAVCDSDLNHLPLKPGEVNALSRLTNLSSDRELAQAVAPLGDLAQPMLRVLQFLRNGDNFAAARALHALQESAVTPPHETAAEAKPAPEPPAQPSKPRTKKAKRAARRQARRQEKLDQSSHYETMTRSSLRAWARQTAEQQPPGVTEPAQAGDADDDDALGFAQLLERFERGEL